MPTAVLLTLALATQSPGPVQAAPVAPKQRPNILILLADDTGVDAFDVYGVAPLQPHAYTPNIDALAQSGVLFRNAWANPICSPTRAAIMTGRYGFRTGIGFALDTGALDHALQLSEVTLPELLDGVYSHAAFGKWHLGNETVGGTLAPNLAGWSHFEGSLGNLHQPHDYFQWPKVIDGIETSVGVYATTDTVDSTLGWIATAPEPWIAYVALNAAHAPLHVPPDGLYYEDLSNPPDPRRESRPYYRAVIEAMDTELGRLIAGLGDAADRTTIVFLGDNGTPHDVAPYGTPPWQGKFHVYQGGVNVPLIVAGAGVEQPGTECQGLVDATDLFATVAELAGVDPADVVPPGTALDSVSLVPYLADPGRPSIRPYTFAEIFHPNGFGPFTTLERAIRDGRYKLVRRQGFPYELYDLWLDPLEQNDLLQGTLTPEEQAAYDALKSELDALLLS